jgi:hypothetical protein
MKTRSCFLLTLSLAALLLSSCRKDEEFPVEPQIEYLNFIKYGNDSADFYISFTDGDGDIGLDKGDTFPPYNRGSIYYYNIYLRYQYKDSAGNYKDYALPLIPPDTVPDTLEWKYRIPVVTPFGQDKSLNGEIHVRLYGPYQVHPTYRYRCYIYDRALNKSNVADSPDLTP